ncbi:hypothetical protein [Pseudoclavibacter sp. VKM Ac-2867]|uniref:hypothetical protein n=1 Tax=Pseudoclavibacter sp. VKM Ac-2867 TaxID=2783829 RepID=UPI00188C36E8|nr:hypothetical protein [Pseudoclavibacter sp. VKM Ac-2867]MBF4459414.1 hypothetical protein [Pseudoclavibacter sp. VKM Ac-2867]
MTDAERTSDGDRSDSGRAPSPWQGDPWQDDLSPIADGEPESGERGDAQDFLDDDPQTLQDEDLLNLDDFTSQVRKVALEDLQARSKTRKQVIRVVLWLIPAIVLLSIGVLVAYLRSEWGQLSAVVMTGWFASVAAQVIGLSLVVFKYLFPSDEKTMHGMLLNGGSHSGVSGEQSSPSS